MTGKERFRSIKSWRGQSFVELAISLPVIILILLGLIEVAFFLGKYMDILDMTRDAARFASLRDPFEILPADASNPLWDQDCSTPNQFDFFYDTACLLSPPGGSAGCPSAAFCNGFNRFAPPDPAVDDIVISVYTVTNNAVSHVWPASGLWAWSGASANYSKDCEGAASGAVPFYSQTVVNDYLDDVSGALPNKGFVAVEYFYCYHQVLNLGMFTAFVPNPVRIHAYTLMPLPAAQPTATPIP